MNTRTDSVDTRFWFYCLLFFFSACSISYELVLARLFSVMSSQEIVWHSVTIGVYVLALGIGTALSDPLLRRISNQNGNGARTPIALLFGVELALTLVGGCSVWLVWEWHTFLRLNWLQELIHWGSSIGLQPVDFSIIGGQLLCLIIGILSGFELPLLAASMKQLHPNEPEESGRMLAANYAGTLAGTIVLLFVLLPHASLGMTVWITAATNLIGAIVLLSVWCARTLSRKSYTIASVLVLANLAWLGFLGFDLDRSEQLTLQATYYLDNASVRQGAQISETRESLSSYPEIVIMRSPYQSLHMVRPKNSPFSGQNLREGEDFSLYLNRHFQISTESEGLYHEFFVHYPLALLAGTTSPKSVLILGGGDGLAARELLRYPEISSVTQVELDPVMIELSTKHPAFVHLNKKSMSSNRVQLIEDDAFTFLKNHHETYDAIFIDFPYPYSFDLSRLYSVEFYSFVLQNLSPGGFAVFDMPLIPNSDPNQHNRVINDIFSSTLKAAGFQFLAPYGGQWNTADELETFMIGMREPPSGEPPEYSKPVIPFQYLFKPGLIHHHPRDFTLQNRPELVNSLFRPRLLGLRSTFL